MIILEGDIVARKSYDKDIIFIVEKIRGSIAILKGLTYRITVDAPVEDLEHVNKEKIDYSFRCIDEKIEQIVKKHEKNKMLFQKRKINGNEIIYTGKILHLDGDRRYTDKSIKYYKKLELNAIVKNIPENKQANVVGELLDRYKPDILIITRT